MLNLHSLFLALLLFVSVVLCVHGEDEKAEAAKAEAATLEEELPIHDCSKPDPGSHRHVDWINKLNGRRIVFLGDSPLRFQYLALGYYLAHGACPESQQQGQDGNILSEESYDNWTEFFQRTSAALTLHTEAFRTAEVCMCSRQAKEPMQVHEQRTFTYQDVQGRRIELVYLQYITEDFQPLQVLLTKAESYQPTDILVSFGEEIKDTDPQCGMTQNEQGVCPYLPWFCWFIKADHPFRVWWLPALPTVVDEKIKDNWHTSHLNLYHRCMLDFDQVIDRRAAIKTLQPLKQLQHELWSSSLHLHEGANHAFNWQLLRRLEQPSNATVSASRHSSRLWKQIFAAQKL